MKFNSLIEHNSSNIFFQHNQTVAFASLEAANWTHTNFTDTGDHVEITFATHQLFIQPTGMHREDTGSGHLASVNVTITAKLFKTNVVKTFTVGNATFTVHGGVEIKLDLGISGWPFVSMSDRLALRLDLHSSINEFEVQEHDGDHLVHENETDTNEIEMNDSQGSNHQGNEEGVVQYLNSDTTIEGFFRFVANAMTDGSSTMVGASFRFEPDEVNPLQKEFKLFLSYHSFSTGLVHDPSVGVVPHPLQARSLVPLALGSVAGLAAVAALARRRKSPLG